MNAIRKDAPAVLTSAQAEQFVEEGYVVLRQAWDRRHADAILEPVWADYFKQYGIRKDDRATWRKGWIHAQITVTNEAAFEAWSPTVRGAVDDVCGKGRTAEPPGLGWWPSTFPGFSPKPWTPPTKGWHVDGQNFHHHIHSPEQGLLTIFLLSDIEPEGGATCIVPGSHKVCARILADAEPHGLSPRELNDRVLAEQPLDPVLQVTGNVGDVALLHPFMLHSVSANTNNAIRTICNPQVSLTEPMRIDREDGEYSLVEIAIKRALEGAAC